MPSKHEGGILHSVRISTKNGSIVHMVIEQARDCHRLLMSCFIAFDCVRCENCFDQNLLVGQGEILGDAMSVALYSVRLL